MHCACKGSTIMQCLRISMQAIHNHALSMQGMLRHALSMQRIHAIAIHHDAASSGVGGSLERSNCLLALGEVVDL